MPSENGRDHGRGAQNNNKQGRRNTKRFERQTLPTSLVSVAVRPILLLLEFRAFASCCWYSLRWFKTHKQCCFLCRGSLCASFKDLSGILKKTQKISSTYSLVLANRRTHHRIHSTTCTLEGGKFALQQNETEWRQTRSRKASQMAYRRTDAWFTQWNGFGKCVSMTGAAVGMCATWKTALSFTM